MCGICGFISRRNVSKEVLEAMNHTLTHRGPDDSGIELFSSNGKLIGLAHRRLSIMDLSTLGHQPMFSNDRNVVVVFNGEIYNFKSLHAELAAEYDFCSSCDTEVILAAYQKWGKQCFLHFDGMFAMAIYDFGNDMLILGRDRIGKKPLYYFFDGQEFVFASELKAIVRYDAFHKDIRKDMLGKYLYHGYIQGEDSIFQNVFKLLPGTMLVVSVNGIHREAWWSLEEEFSQNDGRYAGTYEQAKSEMKELIEQAVRKRLEADVPIGVFFSGGIDSTLITAIMQKYSSVKVKTFTIGFHDKQHNEAEYARKIAEYLDCEHTERYINESEMLNLIHHFPHYFDEPMADAAAIPTLLLSNLAQPEVKVVLTGDGGDEFFCGYDQYEKVRYLRWLSGMRFFLPPKECSYAHHGKIASWMYAIKGTDDKACRTQWVYGRSQRTVDAMLYEKGANELRFCLEDGFSTNDWVRKRMLVDTKTNLADKFLVKTDRATMAHSLEARSPLLDAKVVKASFRMPMNYLKKGSIRKRLLKDILSDYLPPELYERPKHGFSVPTDRWMKSVLFPQLEAFADKRILETQGLFAPAFLNNIVHEFEKGKKDNVRFLWHFYIFQLWYKEYIEDLW